jgi:hypothetical protein
MRRVNPRARTREDRAGDPLDGLVNLFDLGIVLSVAFLLAALSSLDLTQALFTEGVRKGQAPSDAVVVKPGEDAQPIELQPGEKVVGQGEQIGTVYRLEDGRTIIVQPEGQAAPDGAAPDSTAPDSSATPDSNSSDSATPDTNLPDIATDDKGSDDEPTLGEP